MYCRPKYRSAYPTNRPVEVFLAAFRRLDSFEGRSAVRTWLFGITLKVASTLRRGVARRRAEPLPLSLPGRATQCPAHRAECAEALHLVYAVLNELDGHWMGTFICYEAIFPELVREFARQGAEFFVNITNDAWFGNSSAPYQHFAMAAMRCVENRRPMIR